MSGHPVPSPDGNCVAVCGPGADESVVLFDVHKQGTSARLKGVSYFQAFLTEWTPDSKSVLIYREGSKGVPAGVYAAGPDGRNELIAKTAGPYPMLARYSPSGNHLAIVGDNCLEIADAKTGKTLLFKGFGDFVQLHEDGVESRRWDWLDNDKFVFGRTSLSFRNPSLWIANASNRTIKRWFRGEADFMGFSSRVNKLYLQYDVGYEPIRFLRVDPETGKREPVFKGEWLGTPAEVLGVSSDGRLVLWTANISGGDALKLVVVDVASGRESMVTTGDSSIGGVLLEKQSRR